MCYIISSKDWLKPLQDKICSCFTVPLSMKRSHGFYHCFKISCGTKGNKSDYWPDAAHIQSHRVNVNTSYGYMSKLVWCCNLDSFVHVNMTPNHLSFFPLNVSLSHTHTPTHTHTHRGGYQSWVMIEKSHQTLQGQGDSRGIDPGAFWACLKMYSDRDKLPQHWLWACTACTQKGTTNKIDYLFRNK